MKPRFALFTIIPFLLLCFFFISCSHQNNREHPMYITSILHDKNAPQDALKIHQGHFLSIQNSKDLNESILHAMEEENFHLVNLSLEDIATAEAQGIQLEKFKKLIFLNSTVIDVTTDKLYLKENVLSHYTFKDILFIGLSDHVAHENVNIDRFLINDYVYSILKIKKRVNETEIKSFVLIHHLKNEINEIMQRLPPTFINSLAN